ncbi:MAG: Spy/CpxP family protein refolding chaperone [Proteobacteria bacterium]|jgi:protein CpxP|nr:Spy/CpxP family protein refolding chaperone [Pseudomonadota bacterium]
MTSITSRLVLASLLAIGSGLATAQTTPPAAPATGEAAARPAPARMDPAQRQQRMAERQQRMTERHAKRLADLKAQLKISAAQEGAWTQFSGAMQPPAPGQFQRPDRAEVEKMTTPQRIDRMQQMQQQRAERMKQRGDAVKTFYAQLTPEQQKTFDSRAMRHMGERGGRGERHGHHGMHGGPGMGPR